MGQNGGRRPGAGRPKGSKGKALAKRTAAIEKSGQTPLQFMIEMMRNPKASEAMRMDAAKAAAGYIHPKAPATVNLDAKLQITEVRDVIIDPAADAYDTDAPDDP